MNKKKDFFEFRRNISVVFGCVLFKFCGIVYDDEQLMQVKRCVISQTHVQNFDSFLII